MRRSQRARGGRSWDGSLRGWAPGWRGECGRDAGLTGSPNRGGAGTGGGRPLDGCHAQRGAGPDGSVPGTQLIAWSVISAVAVASHASDNRAPEDFIYSSGKSEVGISAVRVFIVGFDDDTKCSNSPINR